MVRGGVAAAAGSAVWRWRFAFALVALLCAAWLIWGDKPWEVAREIEKLRAAGKSLKTHHYAVPVFYWTAAVNLVLALLLLSAARWWARPLPDPIGSPITPAPRYWWPVLVAVVILGSALRLPLASKSLWWDEMWQTKFTASGYYLGEPGAPAESRRYGAASWERAFWYTPRPTNHPMAAVPARLSHLAWKAVVSPAGATDYSNLALRLPTLLISALTLILIACVGRALGQPGLGLAAALLLALHPWHIRYGVDVRGYAYLMLWTTCALFALARLAAGNGGWKTWSCLGLAQFGIVWSYFLAALLAVPLAAGAWILAWRRWRGPGRWVAVGRWLLAHVLAGMLFLQVMGPNLVQMKEFLTEKDLNQAGGQTISAAHLADIATNALLGLPYSVSQIHAGGGEGFAAPAPLTSFLAAFREMPLVAGTAAFFAIVALLAGLVAAAANRRLVAFGAVLVGAVLLAGFFALLGSFFYARFFIFLLPPVVLLIAWGALSLGRRLPWKHGAAVVPLVVIGMIVAASWGRARELLTLPMAPLDDVAAVWRDAIGAPFGEPARRAVIPVGYGHGLEPVEVLVPERRIALSAGDLEKLENEARNKGARLIVALGHRGLNAAHIRDGVERLENSGHYRPLAAFSGIEADYYFRVFEYQPAVPPP